MDRRVFWVNNIQMTSFTEDSYPRITVPFLSILFVLSTMLHLIGFALNYLLNTTLRSYSAFHTHMGVICRHLSAILMVSSLFGILRATYAFHDWSNGNPPYVRFVPEDDCSFSSPMPHYMGVILCILPFLLVIERFYATHNCRSYEYENYYYFINNFCIAMWTPVPFLFLIGCYLVTFYRNSHVICEMMEMNKTPMQRNIWGIIVAFFNLTMASVFWLLEKRNKEFEADYVKNHYSTISIRFQMRENLSTCRFLAHLHVYIALFFLAPFVVDHLLFASDDTVMAVMYKRELWYLSYPLLFIFFPMFFFVKNRRLYLKVQAFMVETPSSSEYEGSSTSKSCEA